MVLANFGDFLKSLCQTWSNSHSSRRTSSAHRQNSFVADTTESLEVRVVPAATPLATITPAVTVAEGDSATVDAVFTVTLSAASTQPSTVSYATEDGSAKADDGDYTAKSGTLNFAAGETSKTITIPVNGDHKFETDETFTVVLLAATVARLGSPTRGVATITNDDPAPTVSIGTPGTVFEGNSGTKLAVFPVTLSNPSDVAVTLHYATADGTATVADNDYESASGSITFAPGETSKNISVTINGDTKAESDETFTVTLSSPTPTSITIPTAVATATIGDDDTLPVLSVNNPAPIDEGATGTVTLLFTVTLSASSTQTVTVAYTTADGTATVADNDYTATSGTLTFAPGQTTKEISVVVKGDTKNEADETILLQLSSPTNARVAVSPGTATITNDDDTLPSVSLSQAVTVTEGNTGTVDTVFHVILSQAAGQNVTVAIATSDGTAKVSDSDYVANSTTITFAPGETDKTFTVKVNGDTKLEGNENFTVKLSDAVNATLGTATIAGTITNDDGGTVSIAKTTDAAETTPPSKGKFTVTQSGVSATPTVVTYTVSGTAIAGASGADSDYQTLSGTVTIPAGQTSATIDVTPFNDSLAEDPETVIVTLTGFTGGDGSIELDPDNQKLTATVQILDAAGVPSLTTGEAVTYTAKQSPIKIMPQATVGAGTLGGGTLAFSVNAVVNGNTIVDRFKFPKIKSLGTTDGFQYVDNKLVLTINLKQSITASDIQSFLRSLKFSTKDSGLQQATRSFVVTLTDAASHATSVTQTINVHASST
ncbi:MAG: Alkaline phosphatase [Planctomycetaceae bacterium]|nr:Alkaline phosphatase [Planctomycetaceae bacterium]